jgi:2-oxoglutarate dehydrogenase E1 component
MIHGTVATPANLEVLEDVYQRWRQDPNSVDPSWRYFFEGFELGSGRPAASAADCSAQTGIVRLIYSYRDLGHFLAHLDPLSQRRTSHPLLELREFGLSDADLERSFDTSHFIGLPHATLRQLLAALRETYCRTIGVEYMHIQDTHIRRWLQERMEPRRNQPRFGRDQKLRVLKSLYYAELFERFLHTRYTGQKRFSLEGAETLIPLLEAVVEKAPDTGVREIILGMSHRGRLNVLANIIRKPYEEIFAQFEDKYLPDMSDGDGDVKYHLGFSCDRVNSRGEKVHLSLSPNPSHLEAVDPVVEGRVRAKQTQFEDTERRRGIPLLIHGDAAFAGQGLVAETLNLSNLAGYTTGGTVHVIVNNQIGFTTAPGDARSTTYCTDVAKMIQAPIFHVNGEDPEAAVYVAELALEFRQEFNRDVVVDMFCYRRHGHNEGDDPSFTQPIMYGKIRERPSLSAIYTEHLIMTGDLTVAETEALTQKFENKLQAALDEVKTGPARAYGMHGFEGQWKGLAPDYSHAPVETGVPEGTLRGLAERLTEAPENFTVHPTVARVFKGWRQEVEEGKPVNWPVAELLAFGSLLLEGVPVRLSGQDSRRGTFSQRHAVVYDARTGEPYSPLNHLAPDQAPFHVYDSLLSEAAVLGFEFGYSLDAPGTLVLWEAQFGDFGNGAQVIIDQFIASSESKWQRDSGVVMLLPHGYEGQGPEHSSARLERFLQMCAEDNMQVANCTTPANYFHILRRQLNRDFRKPLVLMTPKSLLRHKRAVSRLDEMGPETTFHRLLWDDAQTPAAGATPAAGEGSERAIKLVADANIRRVVICSGKVYYDLYDEREKRGIDDVYLLRIEQLYPFPTKALMTELTRFKQAEIVWCQEEPRNMGGWVFADIFLEWVLNQIGAKHRRARYAGRPASASTAVGQMSLHVAQLKQFLDEALR